MSARVPGWLVGRVAAAGALAVCCLCAPSSARAACGDYVQMGRHADHASTPFSLPQRPAKPCSGPGCSEAPAVPPAAPAPVPVSKTAEDWALPALPHLVPDNLAAAAWPAPPGRCPRRPAAEIFHPPR